MKPIEVQITGQIRKSSQEICDAILDTQRWSEFQGYSILPGIKEAHFEIKTPTLVGSRIKVHNTDGSSHVEEIIEWDEEKRVVLKFQKFTPPLQHFATHFIETWEFHQPGNGSLESTHVTRKMRMVPRSALGWLILVPISKLMQKSFEKDFAKYA